MLGGRGGGGGGGGAGAVQKPPPAASLPQRHLDVRGNPSQAQRGSTS